MVVEPEGLWTVKARSSLVAEKSVMMIEGVWFVGDAWNGVEGGSGCGEIR